MEKYKDCLYQLICAHNKSDTILIYFINKLQPYFNLFGIEDGSNYNDLISRYPVYNF